MSVTERLDQQLQALCEAGAAQRDPLRWHYIEVLYRRAHQQPQAVQALLYQRLMLVLQDLASTLQQTPPPSSGAERAASDAPTANPSNTAFPTSIALGQSAHALPSSLAGLLLDLQASTAVAQTGHAGTGTGDSQPAENPRVRQFRQQLRRISVQKQVQQAIAQAPQNAGPINPQMLVLRALALMRDLSPDYLQRFMTHVDTLLCLESAEPSRSTTVRRKTSRV